MAAGESSRTPRRALAQRRMSRGLSHSRIEPTGAPDLAPERERLLDSAFLRPRLHARARVQHRAQDAVDTQPGMPEAGAGVAHFPFGPRWSAVSGETRTPTPKRPYSL